MAHSKMFEKIKRWFEERFWTMKMVWNAVGKKITTEEFKEITGEDYE